MENTGRKHKAQNRRVDIAVLREAFDKAESGVSKTITDSSGQETKKQNSSQDNQPDGGLENSQEVARYNK